MSVEVLKNLRKEEKDTLFNELAILYKRIDDELACLPKPCTACGMCCHFDLAEHRLYISSLEYSYLAEKYAINEISGDVCPHMVNKNCTVRDRRMIGCRTYFRLHNEIDSETAEQLYEKYLKLIKDLYKKNGIPWEYRDLMSYFGED